MKKLPIGIQTFSEIIEENYVYVDKTNFVHQILELYQKCRVKFSSRKEYWNHLRVTFGILLFESWEEYLNFFYSPP